MLPKMFLKTLSVAAALSVSALMPQTAYADHHKGHQARSDGRQL